jgi:hypothetical protein
MAPRTGLEQALAGIFAAVLRLSSVGIHDDFFEIGGNSLLAVRTMSRVSQACGVELAIEVLFDNPTVEKLAAVIALAPLEAMAGTADADAILAELESMSDEEAKGHSAAR